MTDQQRQLMRRLSQRDLSFALLRAFAENRQQTQQQKRNVTSFVHEAVADLLARVLTMSGYVVFQSCSEAYARGSGDAEADQIVEVVAVERPASVTKETTAEVQ
jgi:hypothetical protein